MQRSFTEVKGEPDSSIPPHTSRLKLLAAAETRLQTEDNMQRINTHTVPKRENDYFMQAALHTKASVYLQEIGILWILTTRMNAVPSII